MDSKGDRRREVSKRNTDEKQGGETMVSSEVDGRILPRRKHTHTHAHMCMHTTRAWAHTVPSLAHLGSDVESPECKWDGYAGRLKNSGLRGENCSY